MPDVELTYREAVCQAMREELARDESVFVIGEDVAASGGIFKCSEGLVDEFGAERVRDAPISEAGYMGLCVGAAMTGLRPIAEIMFGDFTLLAMDQLVNQAAKARYMTGGQTCVPLTVRTTMGAGRSSAGQHSQSLHGLFGHIPGLKVAVPSCPRDAKGLIKAAVRDDNPVIIFEDKMSYGDVGPVPEDVDFVIPLGEAAVVRPGRDVTLVGTSSMVGVCLEAAELLAADGIDAEVVDPRTLYPLDADTICASVQRTGYAVVVDEGVQRYGASAELAAVIGERAFDYLDAPVLRLGATEVPVPFSPPLETATIPDAARVADTVRRQRGA